MAEHSYQPAPHFRVVGDEMNKQAGNQVVTSIGNDLCMCSLAGLTSRCASDCVVVLLHN